ncbi:MAG: hypothetical protein KJ063_24925, partial [Anaerolineae bacterium]|nr:hypothetical protein [Anaerolineae bacterium]
QYAIRNTQYAIRNTQYAIRLTFCLFLFISLWLAYPTPLGADEFFEFTPANPVAAINYQPPAQANSFADLFPEKQQ